jgi:hypothetical protein
MSDIRTMNLNDTDDGMVSLDNPSTTFVQENLHEKNMSQSKDTTTMDSTPISELMGGASAAPDIMAPPMMTTDPRMQSVLATAPQMPMQMQMPAEEKQKVEPKSKNIMNLTDDQLFALIAGVCAAAAVSRPVQEKLASTVPKFLGENGSRSAIGLASTGLVAALIFYIAKTYIVKN